MGCLRDFRAAADARFRRATPPPPSPIPVMKPLPRPSKDLQINGPVIEPVMARISVTVIRRDLGISKTSFSSDSFDSGTILPSFLCLFTAASNVRRFLSSNNFFFFFFFLLLLFFFLIIERSSSIFWNL